MTDTYRVARHPEHGLRWWPPGAVIPPENTDVRPATAEEAALMERIRKHGVVAPAVERIEMVSYENDLMCGEPADPIWRIVLNGYCADFPSEGAARNFAAQIAALAALSPLRQAERERAWLAGAEATRSALAAVAEARGARALAEAMRAFPLPPMGGV